ncbi:hypothetical protein HDU99_010635 [Rhizoclosmatium hyalinum]|nr:hypothetical protein HDU99_010635 [Rhizoclosmatium hyalinum]
MVHTSDKHPAIAKNLRELGICSYYLGSLAYSKEVLQEALGLMFQVYRKQEHIDIAITFHALGKTDAKLGNLAEAQKHFSKSVWIMKSVFGDMQHPKKLMIENYNDALNDEIKQSFMNQTAPTTETKQCNIM